MTDKPYSRRDLRLLGKTVRVTTGMYDGQVGKIVGTAILSAGFDGGETQGVLYDIQFEDGLIRHGYHREHFEIVRKKK